ncbi:MAG: acyl-CoA dehydrogenase family protein [Actinomycetota bacterium]
MDFSLSPDQELLRDTARSLLAAECPPSLLRAHMDDPAAADPLWTHLREFAGLGGGPLADLHLFLEETGYVAAPGPFFASTALFAPLLAAIGHELLPAVLAGEVTGTVAIAGVDGVWAVNDDPVKTFVPEADRVDWVGVVTGEHAVALVRAPPTRLVVTVDTTRRLFEVDTAAVDLSDAVALPPDALTSLIERATVAVAAEMVGTARRLFDMTLAYAKERIQFDVPIGSFQAIQHKLADMALELERATSAVQYAAMTHDADDAVGRHRATHVAKAAAGAAATRAAKDGIQIHGGIGYTWEHDLHLFIRRAFGSEHWLGTRADHHDRLADLLI